MTTRKDMLRAFVQKAGWADAAISSLAGDASNRRYDRLERPDATRAVLMDAPPEKGEDVRPFVQIAEHLTQIGLSAPQVIARDEQNGFLLLEDLGDSLFARVLETDPQQEDLLYRAATDVLIQLHKAPPPSVSSYDASVMAPLAALAFDWYQFGIAGRLDTSAKTTFMSEFTALLEPLDDVPRVLIQRDYHAENLLWLLDRQGPARVGLLDFQDAMLGHPAYDLVSFLQDARRDLAPGIESKMIAHFLKHSALDKEAFGAAYNSLGLQRNLRILGVFARLCLRDGKTHYIDLIPRVWSHVQSNLNHPALAGIAPLIRSTLPTPTPEHLAILREKCATFPNQ